MRLLSWRAPNGVAEHSGWASVWHRLSRYWAVVRIERAPRQLRIRETLQLGEKRQLLVVDACGRQLLIGAAGNCLTVLAELEERAEAGPDGCV